MANSAKPSVQLQSMYGAGQRLTILKEYLERRALAEKSAKVYAKDCDEGVLEIEVEAKYIPANWLACDLGALYQSSRRQAQRV
jgi:hypothetical protein